MCYKIQTLSILLWVVMAVTGLTQVRPPSVERFTDTPA
jgi:hypothetical protein